MAECNELMMQEEDWNQKVCTISYSVRNCGQQNQKSNYSGGTTKLA